MLTIEQLTVRYRDVVALDAVDLEVEEAEVLCVLGPSGSGKSTLLRAIAGLEPPSAGRIVRDGTDLAGVPPHQRELGLMFQDHALFPHRDVLGNVAFGLRMHGMAKRAADARAAESLALVGLEGYGSRGVRELSGGEQQRVALARALAPEPRLLMLDEPLGALDRELRERLADELSELFSRLSLSVLLVTHDHDEAFALGDRVAVMHSGHIEQVGPAIDVWRRPANELVARFLGWNVTDALPGGRAAVRPDAVRVSADGALAGVVVARTFRGDHFRVRVALDGRDEVLELAVTGTDPPAVGDALRLSVTSSVAFP
jgi:thiamine transport system ATP-binding protein